MSNLLKKSAYNLEAAATGIHAGATIAASVDPTCTVPAALEVTALGSNVAALASKAATKAIPSERTNPIFK